MRIAIFGIGGVGGYFGAQLVRAGVDVSFIARGAHLAAIRRHGLCVTSPAGPGHVRTLGDVNFIRFGEQDNRRSERTRRLCRLFEYATLLPLELAARNEHNL